MKNLEKKVHEITLALHDKKITANVLVEGSTLKKKSLKIVVDELSSSKGKETCASINETLLECVGYGTLSSNYDDGTLEVTYSPLKEKSYSPSERQSAPGTVW